MPNLAELTDAYDPMGNSTGLPVEQPYDASIEKPSTFSNKADRILNSLFRDDENRYQLWPEKVLREGLTAAGDVTKVNPHAVGSEAWDWYEDQRAKGMIPAAMSISALAGTGGLGGGAEGAVLNATPSLRPALKYKDRLYKGKEGQQHMDVIPQALYPEFEKMAMSGEDISHYNFGFVNDKGHFMDREAALKYGIDSGIIDPQAGKFGALTSTLMADSSKPGTAIEAMSKNRPYKNISDELMGFKKNGQQKGFDETNYSYEQPVKVTFKDSGDTFIDSIKGLNYHHAIERAYRNWKDAEIEPLPAGYSLKPVDHEPEFK